MNHFLKKISLFLLPIFFLMIGMEVLLQNIPNDYKLKRTYLDTNAQDIEILILGSSHSFYGLNPEYFNANTFNASHISQSFSYDYAILEKYERQFSNLKTIILPVSYFSFFETLENGVESWRNKNYAIYYDINLVNSIWEYSEIFKNRLDINIKRLISYYLKKESSITSSSLGWGINYDKNPDINLDVSGKNTSKKHTINLEKTETKEIIQLNKKLLHHINDWCLTNDIELLLFTPPAYKSYRTHLDKKQLELTYQFIDEICHENCNYINLIDHIEFKVEDFYDSDHLSHKGAKKLSRLINNDLK